MLEASIQAPPRLRPALLALLSVAIWVCGPVQAQEYEIAVGDVLTITVAGQPSMSGNYTVDVDGLVALNGLPLKVKASEMSLKEFERKLVTLLADGYLRKPEVEVILKQSQGDRVYVTGQVQKPGAYPLRRDHSLQTLINEMGGLPPGVGHEVIVIRPPAAAPLPPVDPSAPPNPEAEPQAAPTPAPPLRGFPNEVPGSEILRVRTAELISGNPDKNLSLTAGDTVFFPKPANVYITGQVSRPGPLRYEEGLTVFQALTLAGGITNRGSDKVKVIRVVDGKPIKLSVKMMDLLQPEDTLRVPERFF